MKEYKGFKYYESVSEIMQASNPALPKILIFKEDFSAPFMINLSLEDLAASTNPDELLETICKESIDLLSKDVDEFIVKY